MDLYVIRRRGAWADLDELRAAAETSKHVGEEMSDQVRWIRSYVVNESDGRIGSVCIYQARDEESLREHGRRIGAPGEEFAVVQNTVVVRDDPAYGRDSHVLRRSTRRERSRGIKKCISR